MWTHVVKEGSALLRDGAEGGPQVPFPQLDQDLGQDLQALGGHAGAHAGAPQGTQALLQ